MKSQSTGKPQAAQSTPAATQQGLVKDLAAALQKAGLTYAQAPSARAGAVDITIDGPKDKLTLPGVKALIPAGLVYASLTKLSTAVGPRIFIRALQAESSK